MSAPEIMPWNVKDYIADTTHLSNVQHGAYILILLALWRHGGTVVDDDATLARIAKLTIDKWRKVGAPVRALLRPAEGGRLTQKRLAIELSRVADRSSKNSENGRLGGIAKSLKNQHPPPATATPTQPQPPERQNAPTLSLFSEVDSESEKENKKVSKKESSREAARARGPHHLPDDWALTTATHDYAVQHGFGDQINELVEAFRDHHRQKGTKGLDWDAGWRMWVRNEIKFYGYRRFGGRGNPGSHAANGSGKITPADLASGRFRRTP